MLGMKRLVTGATTAGPASFNNLGDIPSGPAALLFFNNIIFPSISTPDQGPRRKVKSGRADN